MDTTNAAKRCAKIGAKRVEDEYVDNDISLLILGAGGHAKVVADAASAAGVTSISFCDEGAGDDLAQCAQQATHIHVAIGDNTVRTEGFARAIDFGLTPLSIIHPSAYIAPTAHVGEGVFVGAFCVLNPDSNIGDYAVINTASIIEHDCVVGQGSFVAPGAIMCGGCFLGSHSLLGAHATMIPQTHIGNDVIVGAGATVVSDFKEKCLVVGTPAKKAFTKEKL